MSETNTKTQTAEPVLTAIAPVFDPNSLPVVVVTQVQQKGDLIDIGSFEPAQIQAAATIVQGFDINNTISILRFAAKPQTAMSGYLDQLLGDVRVKDAGVAGQIAMSLAQGIDLLKLDKVKKQILNPPSNGIFTKIFHWLSGWTNYLKAFYLAQVPVMNLIREIENKANNKVLGLTGQSNKLDGLAVQSAKQVGELGIWILAGEQILLEAIERYKLEREEILESKDPVKASQLRDFARQIAAFEKRLLETKIAYVEAGNVTIPRVRAVQEAIKIEIQNISEQILFQLPKFKAAIIQMAALKDVADAQQDRRIMDENERNLDRILDETTAAVYRASKESQGDPLEKVRSLEITIQAIKACIDEGVRLESDTRQKRAEAERLLVGLKDVVTEALKTADVESATV